MTAYGATLLSILAVHFLAMVSPGPNFLIVTQTAISRSRREGLLTAVGVACAAVFWSGAALLGLQLLFETTTWFYRVVKVLGGAYLVYLALTMWLGAGRMPTSALGVAASPSNWRAFRTGFVTNITNPKSAVFFGSIFASFLPPNLPAWVRAAAMGLIVFNVLWWHLALALTFSAPPAQRVYLRAKRGLDYLTGSFLLLVGVRLMLSRE